MHSLLDVLLPEWCRETVLTPRRKRSHSNSRCADYGFAEMKIKTTRVRHCLQALGVSRMNASPIWARKHRTTAFPSCCSGAIKANGVSPVTGALGRPRIGFHQQHSASRTASGGAVRRPRVIALVLNYPDGLPERPAQSITTEPARQNAVILTAWRDAPEHRGTESRSVRRTSRSRLYNNFCTTESLKS